MPHVNIDSLREQIETLPADKIMTAFDRLHRMAERNIARVSALQPPFYAVKANRRWNALLGRLYEDKQSIEQLAGFYQDGLLKGLCLPTGIHPPLEGGEPEPVATELDELLGRVEKLLCRARKQVAIAA